MARVYIKGWARLRKEAIERAGGLCQKCNKDIAASGQIPEVNHIRAIIDGGDPEDPDNLECLCPDCHKPHTKAAVQRKAKIKRIQDKAAGKIKKWKRKIQSKPMSKFYRPVNPQNRNKPIGRRGKMA